MSLETSKLILLKDWFIESFNPSKSFLILSNSFSSFFGSFLNLIKKITLRIKTAKTKIINKLSMIRRIYVYDIKSTYLDSFFMIFFTSLKF